MQRKFKLMLITILVMFMSIAIANSKVEAATVTISPVKTSYYINGSERVYRYTESKGNYYNIFCMSHGNVLNTGSVYSVNADLYSMSADQIKSVFGSNENYNKALWIIDNMVINQNQNKDEMNVMVAQLKEALHSGVAINAISAKYNLPKLTTNDIDNVINHIYTNGKYDVFYATQQCVLWNYTNNKRSFNELTALSSGTDIEGKYYRWMYTGLKAVADTKGNYNSPNKGKNITSIINNITMDSKSATIDVNNRKIGPFILNGYNSEIMTKREYAVTINGKKLENSDYSFTFAGNEVYFTIKNTSYNLTSAKIDIAMNVKATSTTGSYLYKQNSQNIISLYKDVVCKHLTGSTEDTEFDLRLIKNISEVWNVGNSQAKLKVDLNATSLKSRNIQRVSSIKKGDTTENWYINKYPVTVSTGDIIKYDITIANEGNLDGYATKITDYLADGLELVSKDELVKLKIMNQNDEYYGWVKEKSTNLYTPVSTTYLSDKKINAYNQGADTVDTKVVHIYCKVTSSVAGRLLNNVAEITEEKATNSAGQQVTDRDSTPGNIKTLELSYRWKGNSGNKDIEKTNIKEQYFYPGKEDDDDFEIVKIQNFDLALTKEITSIEYPNGNKVDLTRLVDIDKKKLYRDKATTATYNMNKSLVNVTKDAIITYKITVYNEGSADGYAREITDYLPKGLEFYSSEVDGEDYMWRAKKNDDGTSTILTRYLYTEQIDAYTTKELNSKSVKVKCKVTSDETGKILTNVAEITSYGYYVGNVLIEDNYVSADKGEVDVDSIQNNIDKLTSKSNALDIISSYEQKVKSIDQEKNYISKEKTNYEDDDDFENVIIGNKSLDLALRKSISAVNGQTVVNDYNLTENRLPKITGETALSALATGNAEYYHNKEAIKVNQNDEITYTIRVYNEGGEDDYSGYAKEITDYLPEGLTFVKIDDSSTAKWQTTSKEGDSTVKLKYTGNETICNNSLYEIYKRNYMENNDMTNLYQTVSIICKVNGTTGYLTNRAEISDEVATDENGAVINGIKDRDSTPGSLSGIDLNLKNYYNYYNTKYGISDTYNSFYAGEENGKIEDDIDFETVYVKAQTIDINGTKTWNDEGNKDKTRPEKITIYLLANGKQADAKEISEADGWKYSFTGLAKYDDNKQEIKYTVDESEVAKYTKQINGYDIVNTYIPPETVDISGTKTWNDEGNKDKTRPEKITIYLLANGTQVDAKEISEKDGWKYSFTGLAKYDDNKQEIKYTVDESEVAKYTKQINGYDIINTYTTENPETVDVSGTKTWNDGGNKDKTRPEKITIYLLANGTQVDAKEISEADGWKYIFTGLAKYDDNKQEIKYTVDESEVAKYTKQINGYDIINTYTTENPETVDVSGTKTWNDGGNKDETRPEKITIYLLANGKQVDAKEISEKDGWKYSFTELPKYDDNKQEIKYTVDESEVEKYTKQINGYDIINTYTTENPETIDVNGVKTWNDANNKDGIRPKAIKVKLLANEKEKTSVITTEEQDWKYSFTELPKFDDNGKEIKYTVDEETVSGYTKKVDGYNITNTHTPTEKLDFSLRKFITEINSVAVNPSRAPQVDVTNLANGTSTTATYNHPKDAKTVNTGDVVTYTIRAYNEGEVDGYVSLIKDEIPEGLQYITNDATNTTYGWKMLDADGKETSDVSKAKYVTTDYLSKEKSENNLIAKFNKETKQLSYKDVKVSFKVVSEDTTGKEIINHAQISKETNSNGKIGTDIDSTPDKWIDGEDDQDIEKVKLTYADLALRKFITKINNEEVNPNRAPQVDVTNLANGTSTTATYNHPKNTVGVSRNDIVLYTLRIYNEGTRDAIAALVKDNIPAGLQFIPSDDLNKKYNWKMLDENNNETTKVSEAKYVVTDYLSNSVIKAYDSTTMDTLDYKDVEIAFKVIAEESTKNEITNHAQISKETDSNGNTIKDRDSTPDEWIDGEDDQDIEKIKLTYADLALRKFITELNSSEINPSRAPQVDVTNLVNGTITTATYNHSKEPVEVRENDIVTYTLRIYNEGTKNVYASLVEDDIPEGLEFITDNEINKQYKWKILDENRNEVADISKAKYIVTDYLANDLIKAFDPQTMSTLDYRDVKVSFKVKAPTEKGQQIINYAQITKETDDSGKDVKDRDSTPGKWVDGEDDQDTEIIKLKYFDLALQKWVSKAIVIEDGKERVTKTGHTGDMNPEPVVKVDLKKSKVKNVVVKFEYQIRVENQGQIAGYAKEVSDYIPQGLKFVKDDNQNWREVDGKIVTNQLENILLQPGESTTISVILTWINDSNNLGLKTNIAEISEDADDHGNSITDIDSTPNNQVDGEDDQDNAPVILTIKTGETTIYTSVIIAVIVIIGVGVYGIKKYVLR